MPDTPQDLVMRVFERLLSENDLLVRRQLFDFLVPNLPLDCHFFLVNSRKVKHIRVDIRVRLKNISRVTEKKVEKRKSNTLLQTTLNIYFNV